MEFLPNPRLLTALGNNLVPAIAAVMLRDGVPVDELTSDYIIKGAAETRNQRLFQSHIGKFNLDPDTGAVELSAFFNHVCPATRVLTEGLGTWLPKMYDQCAA